MLRPGRYRALGAIDVELCLTTGEYTAPTVKEITSYDAGDKFTIPETVNGYFYRHQKMPYEMASERIEEMDA
jgi:hypothetical protein